MAAIIELAGDMVPAPEVLGDAVDEQDPAAGVTCGRPLVPGEAGTVRCGEVVAGQVGSPSSQVKTG